MLNYISMTTQDIRWVQRLNHFNHAFALAAERNLSDLEQQGLIQGFEYTHELAWKTLKDFLEHRGTEALYGSKDVRDLTSKIRVQFCFVVRYRSDLDKLITVDKGIDDMAKKYLISFKESELDLLRSLLWGLMVQHIHYILIQDSMRRRMFGGVRYRFSGLSYNL